MPGLTGFTRRHGDTGECPWGPHGHTLESAKGRLVAAANEGGMATGTSSELPAVVLDKLGDFLAEDPFGNLEKVDKFCTYLEKNGPAALHVADGKKVDLDRLFNEVVK